jgi:hypothetical protein
MMWKRALILLSASMLIFAFHPAVSHAQPLTLTIQLQAPDTLRIPSTIALLESTPFYDSPSFDDDNSVGVIAPQDGIKVLGGEFTWSRGSSWWKIQTWLGEKWIHPNAWDVDIPPPPRLSLFDETPIYASKNDKLQPSAVLSPQEVQVVDAEKQWFYSNDPNEKKWIKIHTSWLGDQWVHLPVNQIGYVNPVDYYFYYGYQYVMDLPVFNGGAYYGGNRFVSAQLQSQTVHVTGEFVTVYDKNYQVEMPNGTKFVFEKGMLIEKISEEVALKTNTPLFSLPFGGLTSIITTLKPQTVKAFEKIKDSTMYHVRTELGEGWVSSYYAEPENPTPTQATIELKGDTQLSILPRSGFQINGAKLTNQTVKPTVSWKDEENNLWYQLQTKDGNAWFTIDPKVDQIHMPDDDSLFQLHYQQSLEATIKVFDQRLFYYGIDVGYMKEGQPYLSTSYLAQQFNYSVVMDDKLGTMTFSQENGYSFHVKLAKAEAVTFWKGKEQEKMKLTVAPEQIGGVAYLSGKDASTLLGANIDWFKNKEYFYLFTDVYGLDEAKQVPQTKDNKLTISAYMYDRIVGIYDAQPSLLPKLSVYNSSGKESEAKAPTITDKGTITPNYKLFVQSQSTPLQAGDNAVTAAIKLGSRIIWQQDYTVQGAK